MTQQAPKGSVPCISGGSRYLALAGCVSTTGQRAAPDSRGHLVDAQGVRGGFAEMFVEGDMLRVELAVRGLVPGTYAISVHDRGRCTGRRFAGTGGLAESAPALDSLRVELGIIARQTYRLAGALRGGDGFALILHAAAAADSAETRCVALR